MAQEKLQDSESDAEDEKEGVDEDEAIKAETKATMKAKATTQQHAKGKGTSTQTATEAKAKAFSKEEPVAARAWVHCDACNTWRRLASGTEKWEGRFECAMVRGRGCLRAYTLW